MNKGEITSELFQLRDEGYADFQAKLIPNIPREKIIGVRTPIIKSLAKKISDEARDVYIKELPHDYFDEDQLHAFIISL
ncbi:MAG: DNA alkylation repair protein, partial [Clostridia bacterium]|nr:DNA alkylation repair protein [Clostridia bacterium]